MSETQEYYNPDEQKVYDLLEEMGIPYLVRHHVPVFTTEDAQIHRTDFPGIKMKNLFVKTDSDYSMELVREASADYYGYQTTKITNGFFDIRFISS
jgi:hypothetical protein